MKRKLTEAEWKEVFQARCRSKEGRSSQDDRQLCARAYSDDPKRYSGLNEAVFNATAPFGATRKEKKGVL